MTMPDLTAKAKQTAVAERVPNRLLTAAEFQRMAGVPAAAEWFANIDNANTRRAYQNALADFMTFTRIEHADEFRDVTRAHAIAWRDELAGRELSGMTIRHRLAALSSLFEHLCEKNAVTHNPVKGTKRPRVEYNNAPTPRCAGGSGPGQQTEPRDPGHPSLSRAAPGGAVQAQGP